MPGNATIVTALFDLSRFRLTGPFRRGMDEYLVRMGELLQTEQPMIIHTSPDLAGQIREMRGEKPTVFRLVDTHDMIQSFPWLNHTNTIRQNREWLKQADWLPESPQARLEGYNPLVMSKLFWLADAARENPFGSSHLYWLDAGITQTVHPGYFTHDRVLDHINIHFEKFGFICYPYVPANEVHGFSQSALAEYCRVNRTTRVARGGFFGGPVNDILSICTKYRELLNETLTGGLMGTEESVFTILSYRYADEISVFYIDSDGLLSGFFEDVKNGHPRTSEPVSASQPGVGVTGAELERWHEECIIHLQSAIYDAFELLGDQKRGIGVIDIGAVTGRFTDELEQRYNISFALETDPIEETHSFALSRGKKRLRIYGYPGEGNQPLHLNRFDHHNGNLGIFTVTATPEYNGNPVPFIDRAALFKACASNKIDLIRIHSAGNGLGILAWLEPLIAVWQHRPHIIFDHQTGIPGDELAAVLHKYQALGYSHKDPYAFQGGNIMLKHHPDRVNPHAADKPVVKKLFESIPAPGSISYPPGKTDAELITYVLTYNQPQQLAMLLSSFEKYGSYLLYRTRKILLDNSDTDDTREAYRRLADQYGFEHFRVGNLGISGGRQWVADHFDASAASWMLFFEDDMLLAGPDEPPCKNGLVRYIPDLFPKLLSLMKTYEPDFIKLSFTEFFGDNATQWAWFNVPEDVRGKLFPDQPVRAEGITPPLTKFQPPRFSDGLTWMEGDIYYSNWPHIISRKGNKAMFLDTRWHFPSESTWMSHFYQKTIEKKLKPAVLLATTIKHHRAFHYEGADRREFSDKADFTKTLI